MALKYLIVNAFGRSNRGDSVLLDECIEQMRKVDQNAAIMGVLFEGVSSAQAVHPDVDWSERIGNARRFSGLIGRIEQLVYLLVAWLACATGWFRLAQVLPQSQVKTLLSYRTANTVVSAPGGYIHDTNMSYIIALLHIHIGTLLGSKVILAPQSIGPIRSTLGTAITRFVLSRCALICVREGYSREFLVKRLGIASDKIVVAGDSAFWNLQVTKNGSEVDNVLEQIGLARDESFVGVTVVDWPFPHQENVAEYRARYEQSLVKVLGSLYREHGLRTVIFNQVATDLDLAHRVAARSGAHVLVHKTETEPEILRAAIGRARIFVGTRFHSCIFAMMEARPLTAISYLPKTEFIMKDLRLEDRVIDIDSISPELLSRLVIESLKKEDALSARIDRAVKDYRSTKIHFGEALAEVVAANKGQPQLIEAVC
ncbi:polysaccharide pyruvyl transferase family protein [Bradyrhizobium sp. Arg237L]|uniref:polysaccharide pyruvyl transferase family protein n=1 Tax=Bradyrhizobium sp. Arg237L TaxID=3003352 RepID=UPI00249F609F|nr:polysaccharide pyruvyl transferase family protein [Bradyrhizobium sp. Arg237L]MDI4238201.1 polysaccharide pyruvyl transferase family protein [Bradyrhizobium sp. Arg237L]